MPKYAAASLKRDRLWPAQDAVAQLDARRRGVVSRVEQSSHAALRYDRENADARRLLAQLYFDAWGRALAARDAPEAARVRELVETYGGQDLLAGAEAPVRVALTATPADAVAYLFRYEERDRRLVPVPWGAVRDQPSAVRQMGVDPVAVDAPEEERRRVREGTAYPLECGENRVTFPMDLPPGFVFVPAGGYIAGADPNAQDYTGEGRAQRTDLRPPVEDFYIQRYSVTCGEYLEFLNDRGHHTVQQAYARAPRVAPDSGQYWQVSGDRIEMGPSFAPDWPVFGVPWNDAVEYARWYTDAHGRGVWEFRLPTEDEWEKAARGVDGRWFSWGDRFDEGFCAMLDSREATEGRPRNPEPYGLFAADESVYGVRDTAGCMRNWTATESGHGAWRIVRGGGWGTPAAWSRAAGRIGDVPTNIYAVNGLRLAVVRRTPDDF